MYDLDPKVKVIGKKAGICDGVPSTAALVIIKVDGPDLMEYNPTERIIMVKGLDTLRGTYVLVRGVQRLLHLSLMQMTE